MSLGGDPMEAPEPRPACAQDKFCQCSVSYPACPFAQHVVRAVNAVTSMFNPRFLVYLVLGRSLPAIPLPLLGVGTVAAAAGLGLGQLLQVGAIPYQTGCHVGYRVCICRRRPWPRQLL